jgi:hypothetical protein
MALVIPCHTKDVISIEDYVHHIRTRVDLRDQDSIGASAPMLRALANDRTLVVRRLNKLVESAFTQDSIPSAQTVFLGQGKNFYVRAAIWPSSADIAGGRIYQDRFAYNVAHDHNFTFMTVSYLGPGYETDIYEYDPEKVEGYVGESVDIRFLDKVKFAPGMVMLYRASRDVHIQHPPEELTITLNLIISHPEVRMRDQFFFDLQNRIISEFPTDSDSSKRVSLLNLAEHFGNADTRQLLFDLAHRHPCRRTRLRAYEALGRQVPLEAVSVWESACSDAAPLVVNAARKKLNELAD